MAAVLIRLKLRLLVNGLRASSSRMQFFVLSSVGAVLFGAGGFLVFLAGPPRLPPFAFPLFAAAWAVFPLLAFGLDETLDPARLATLPLRRRDVMPGLFVASALGPWPLAFLVVLLGAVPGYARSPDAVVVALAAVTVTFVFCLALSRAVATSMARLLRSRRGKDLGVLVGGALSMLIVLAGQTLQPRSFDTPLFTDVLRWTPPGMAGRALFEIRWYGDVAGAAVEVLAAAVLTVGVVAWWALAVGGAQVPSDASTGGGRRARFGGGGALGAVVAKELRYALREPARRAQLPSLVVPAAMFALGADRFDMVFPVAGIAVLAGLAVTSNQVGEDGSAYWLHVSAGDSALLGKTLVRGGLAAVLTTGTGVGAAVATGRWAELPAALLTAYGALGLALGLGSVISVRVPFPPPKSGNPFSADPGKGCLSGAYLFGAMLACAVLLAPAVVLSALGLPYAGAALALAVGAGGWVVGSRVAEGFAERAQPEILAAIVRNGG